MRNNVGIIKKKCVFQKNVYLLKQCRHIFPFNTSPVRKSPSVSAYVQSRCVCNQITCILWYCFLMDVGLWLVVLLYFNYLCPLFLSSRAECMMGSFRRPRPRFMSSPVLSDLARFHASSPALQISNTSVWNRSAAIWQKIPLTRPQTPVLTWYAANIWTRKRKRSPKFAQTLNKSVWNSGKCAQNVFFHSM